MENNNDINFDEQVGSVPLVPALTEAAQREKMLEQIQKANFSWRSPTKKYVSKAKAKRRRQIARKSRQFNYRRAKGMSA